MSRNEAFPKNIIGKTISFDVQPYAHGKMVIEEVSIRVIDFTENHPQYGRVNIKADVYDVVGTCTEGTEIGAFIAGVPVRDTVKSLKGCKYSLVGLSYKEIVNSYRDGKTIVKCSV